MYTDTLYHTYCFEQVPYDSEEVALKGTLKDTSGALLKWTDVMLVDQNHFARRAMTNQLGQFTIHGHRDGPARILAPGIDKLVTFRMSEPITVDLVAPGH